jgi:type II secretory pathway component GspD/PulD (secretin)
MIQINGTPTIAYSINYLVQNNKARVLANPKILITNGKESVIDLTSDYIIETIDKIFELYLNN